MKILIVFVWNWLFNAWKAFITIKNRSDIYKGGFMEGDHVR